MCGINGFFNYAGITISDGIAHVRSMNKCIEHRGPDDSGVWQSDDGRVALGHQRLSILDLSSAGHQPMRSPGGAVVVFMSGGISFIGMVLLAFSFILAAPFLIGFALFLGIADTWLDVRSRAASAAT